MDKVYVCEEKDIGDGRRRFTVKDRDIFIIHKDAQYYAMDSFCYHAGGPLYQGDIEEYGGKTCVTCPWHRFRICIDSGEGLYESVNPFKKSQPTEIKSKGVKQRTHQVIVEDQKIYVQLSTIEKLESDVYNDQENRKKLGLGD